MSTPPIEALLSSQSAGLPWEGATIMPRPRSPAPESRCAFFRARRHLGTDDGNAGRRFDIRTPAENRTPATVGEGDPAGPEERCRGSPACLTGRPAWPRAAFRP